MKHSIRSRQLWYKYGRLARSGDLVTDVAKIQERSLCTPDPPGGHHSHITQGDIFLAARPYKISQYQLSGIETDDYLLDGSQPLQLAPARLQTLYLPVSILETDMRPRPLAKMGREGPKRLGWVNPEAQLYVNLDLLSICDPGELSFRRFRRTP